MPDVLSSDDLEALAAEYVLGTLDAEERRGAAALLEVDHAFRGTVRIWERRLGELHLMVEPIEPDPMILNRIKARLGHVAQIPISEEAPLPVPLWPDAADEAKPDEAKPDEAKPDGVTPDETKPAEVEFVDVEPVEAQLHEDKPAEDKSIESQTAEDKAAEEKPADVAASEAAAPGAEPLVVGEAKPEQVETKPQDGRTILPIIEVAWPEAEPKPPTLVPEGATAQPEEVPIQPEEPPLPAREKLPPQLEELAARLEEPVRLEEPLARPEEPPIRPPEPPLRPTPLRRQGAAAVTEVPKRVASGRGWKVCTILTTLIALALAALIGAWRYFPEKLPPQLRATTVLHLPEPPPPPPLPLPPPRREPPPPFDE